jgi:four helix bundle protein
VIKSYKDLEVYKRSYKVALKTHKLTLEFPDIEKHELGSQLRRASKSIPLNIGEGYGKRSSANEFKLFLIMAIGSCDEVKILIEFAKDLKYIKQSTYEELKNEYERIGKMLYRLHQNWQKQ